MVTLSQPLSMRQAASRLGFGDSVPAARKLTRLVRKREQEIGKKILIGGGRGRRIYITIAALRKHYDDLVDEGGYLNKVLDDLKSWITDEVKVLQGRDRVLGANIRKLRREVAELTKVVQSSRF